MHYRIPAVRVPGNRQEAVAPGKVPRGVAALRGADAAVAQQHGNVLYCHAGGEDLDGERVAETVGLASLDTREAGNALQPRSPEILGGPRARGAGSEVVFVVGPGDAAERVGHRLG